MKLHGRRGIEIASGTSHISINKQNIRASAGDRIGFRFAVRNVDDTDDLTVVPEIECSPDNDIFRDDSEIFIDTTIAPGEMQTMSYANRLISGLEHDLYLCRLTVPGARGQADFQINIR